MKVVINSCFGGFSLSQKALRYMADKGDAYAKDESQSSYGSGREVARDDPLLVEVVQVLGEEANGGCADLKIVDIPDGIEWEIQEYDGYEHIAEKHRTWF